MTKNVSVEDALLARVVLASGSKSEREAVEAALREYLTRHPSHPVLDLVGEDLLSPDYDVRAVRAGMDHRAG